MNASTIDGLEERFGISGVAEVVAGLGELAMVRVTLPAAEAEIYLHGAHLASWRPAGGEPVIFMSAKSRWEEGKAIRGGIPICFPWFGERAGDASAPQHGFARTSAWELVAIEQLRETVAVVLKLESSMATRELWPFAFEAEYRVTVGPELRLELTVTNKNEQGFEFEEALHTYFAVSEVESVRVEGLAGKRYRDKPDGFREKGQAGEIGFTGLVDRVYLEAPGEVRIVDGGRTVLIGKENSETTVVWNPWVDGARALADMGDEEWRRFVCVETANSGAAAVRLGPGESHRMTATIRLL